jgi:X-Pro dipeptidyl-peptidase
MAKLERDQDRETGDFSRYWDERDYVQDADKVKASVFLVHGLHDDNVRTQQMGQWWDALAKNHVPRKIWLHQGEHADPFNVRRDVWLDTLHQWFDYWLYGVDNGVMRQPMADVEVAPNQWRTSSNWPVPQARTTALKLGNGRDQTFVDNPSRTAEDLAANPDVADPNRFVHVTAPLSKDTRMSGNVDVTVKASLNGESPYLSALLVDYGTGTRYAGTRTLPVQDCIGPGITGDPGCFNQREYVTAETPYEIVTRGWLDVRNRTSLSRTTPVTPGREYTFQWNLQPNDHVFAAGHRIGVVLISTERDHTLRYPAGTVVKIDPGSSKVVMKLS